MTKPNVIRHCAPSSLLNLDASFRTLSLPDRILLMCIEEVRSSCCVSGRYWLSVLRVIRQRYDLDSLLDAYRLVQKLYGVNWLSVQFDFANVNRICCGDFDVSKPIHSRNPANAPLKAANKIEKYYNIIDKLDLLLQNHLPNSLNFCSL